MIEDDDEVLTVTKLKDENIPSQEEDYRDDECRGEDDLSGGDGDGCLERLVRVRCAGNEDTCAQITLTEDTQPSTDTVAGHSYNHTQPP